MIKRKSEFGRNLSIVLDGAPPKFVTSFLESHKAPEVGLLQPPDVSNRTEEAGSAALREYLRKQDPELLSEIDRVCASIVELSEDKGVTSIKTVAGDRLTGDEYDQFEDVPDPLCKSLWLHSGFPSVFQDAASFHAARRYRERKRLYDAYEAGGEMVLDKRAAEIDRDQLCERLDNELRLRAKSSASVIDLPKTKNHPPSVMVAIRHPGALSSIKDHRAEGGWTTYYYRPSHEAVLIYTPSTKKIEVCAESFEVRRVTADTFAEFVLGQNLSNKPLARRNFNMERFRQSFDLELPDFEDVEILGAVVVEVEVPLGSWKRRLGLKVTKTDSIEHVLSEYAHNSQYLIRKFGFSRVAIVVSYALRETKNKGTLRIDLSGGNISNVQSQADPFLRDLGFRLLAHWGLTEDIRPLSEAQKARWLKMLLDLYELPGDTVEGGFFSAASVDPTPLIRASIVKRKSRQVDVLLDDGDVLEEVELETGPVRETLLTTGPFGEVRGSIGAQDATVYTIDRDYLAELVLKILAGTVTCRGIEIIDDHFALIGTVLIDEKEIPVYLARQIGNLKIQDCIDNHLRRRSVNGPGIVLASMEDAPQYLGPNVVIRFADVLASRADGQVVLDVAALDTRFSAARNLVGNVQVAQVLRSPNHTATLILPGEDPQNLDGAYQITLFERLVSATNSGVPEMRTKALMADMGSDNPKQLFRKPMWDRIFGVYISHGSSNRFWKLGKPAEKAV